MASYPKYNDISGTGAWHSSRRRVAPAPRDVSETDISLDDQPEQPVLLRDHPHFLQLMSHVDTIIPETIETRANFNNTRGIFNQLSSHPSFSENPLMQDIDRHLDNRYNTPYTMLPHDYRRFIGRVLRSGLPHDQRPPLE